MLALSLLLVISVIPAPFVSASEAPEPMVRVKLTNSQYVGSKSSLTLIPETKYSTNLSNVTLEANQTYNVRTNGTNVDLMKGSQLLGSAAQIEIKPQTGKGPLSINGHLYLGSFSFTNENGKFVRPFNTIGIEDYLKGVVPAEMPALWNMEALKSQAVAARTYAMGYVNKTPDDTINFQVYAGYKWHQRATQAVEATEGQVIAYNGNSINSDALFSSSNGGRTESNANVWGGTQRAYLKVKEDPFDPKTVWSFNMKKQQIDTSKLDLSKADAWWAATNEVEQTKVITNIKTWIKANGYAGKDVKVTAVPVLSLGGTKSGGRVSTGTIHIDFLVKEPGKALEQTIKLENVSASRIRAIIGLDLMKSYLVDSVDTASDTIKVSGKGYGHGVGLSQYGAKKAGELGKTYQEILAFYFEGTTLKKMYKTAADITAPVTPDPAPAIPAPAPVPVTPPAAPAPVPAKDETAPIINEIKTAFDAKSNLVNVSFATNEAAKISIQVLDLNGKVVATILNVVQKPTGAQTASWNVANVNNGKYAFVISAEDASSNKAAVTTPFTIKKPAPKDTVAPTIKNAATSYDAKTQRVSLKYEINEPSKMTIQVKDLNGKVVATILNGVQNQAGAQTATWNVANVNNGKYTFVISAEDASSNKAAVTTSFTIKKPAPKDTVAPTIKNTATSYDAKTQKAFLKYEINEDAKMTIVVKDSKGKTVATPANNLAVKKGIRWASWDASKLANGTYSIAITAVDSSNNKRSMTVAQKLAKPAPKKMTGKVTATTLNVRATASTTGKVIGTVKKNQTITILSKEGTWYKIEFQKRTGYVHANYVSNVK
ncbi:SpoIID/LytB domain-containing protein [Mesobacillus campisalis]|uniref:SpoIID/LytB domain-containing protein n=1 Tax=Mesobacillus campisalis TaxID=1408103 RepID=UPI0012E2C9EF|nr:SpoIID/LytB domain-containing protein [Mesobacillus campisalis]